MIIINDGRIVFDLTGNHPFVNIVCHCSKWSALRKKAWLKCTAHFLRKIFHFKRHLRYSKCTYIPWWWIVCKCTWWSKRQSAHQKQLRNGHDLLNKCTNVPFVSQNTASTLLHTDTFHYHWLKRINGESHQLWQCSSLSVDVLITNHIKHFPITLNQDNEIVLSNLTALSLWFQFFAAYCMLS